MNNKIFNKTAIDVLKKRYLLKDKNMKIVETPDQMFKRVAKHAAKAEKKQNRKKTEQEFYRTMSNLDFLPNSPTLMNAGTQLGQLSACFVIPIEDSIQQIFEALKQMAIIHQSGGGTGFNFSKIRPEGDIIHKSKGTASGPISFIKIFDKAAEIIKQGGRRRGANMGILEVNHPDILKFIKLKQTEKLENFNISVAITNKFMQSVKKNKTIKLINPRTKKAVKEIKARKIFHALVESAWSCGDPGILFMDEINSKNLLKLGRLNAVNPCGEQPLYDYESCNLGSINLANMVIKKEMDWEKLRQTIRIGVQFLDDILEVNKFPFKEIEKNTKANRKIGIGVMGFAEMLIKLKISYKSEEAVKTAEKTMKFINEEARKKSEELGKQKGNFPNKEKSKLAKKYKHMRNATVTTIAPTGTISIIAGTSSAIEPLFALIFERKIMDSKIFFEINKLFEKELKRRGLYKEELLDKVARAGSIKQIKEIPKDMKKIFVTSMDIKPEQHVKIQAEFQKHIDNAVSKTVNLPFKATKKQIAKIFMQAYEMKCKGITVYRYGSKGSQVFNVCTTC